MRGGEIRRREEEEEEEEDEELEEEEGEGEESRKRRPMVWKRVLSVLKFDRQASWSGVGGDVVSRSTGAFRPHKLIIYPDDWYGNCYYYVLSLFEFHFFSS